LYIAVKNRAFRSLIGISAFLPAGMIMVAAGFPYLCTQVLEVENDETPGLVRMFFFLTLFSFFFSFLLFSFLLTFQLFIYLFIDFDIY